MWPRMADDNSACGKTYSDEISGMTSSIFDGTSAKPDVSVASPCSVDKLQEHGVLFPKKNVYQPCEQSKGTDSSEFETNTELYDYRYWKEKYEVLQEMQDDVEQELKESRKREKGARGLIESLRSALRQSVNENDEIVMDMLGLIHKCEKMQHHISVLQEENDRTKEAHRKTKASLNQLNRHMEDQSFEHDNHMASKEAQWDEERQDLARENAQLRRRLTLLRECLPPQPNAQSDETLTKLKSVLRKAEMRDFDGRSSRENKRHSRLSAKHTSGSCACLVTNHAAAAEDHPFTMDSQTTETMSLWTETTGRETLAARRDNETLFKSQPAFPPYVITEGALDNEDLLDQVEEDPSSLPTADHVVKPSRVRSRPNDFKPREINIRPEDCLTPRRRRSANSKQSPPKSHDHKSQENKEPVEKAKELVEKTKYPVEKSKLPVEQTKLPVEKTWKPAEKTRELVEKLAEKRPDSSEAKQVDRTKDGRPASTASQTLTPQASHESPRRPTQAKKALKDALALSNIQAADLPPRVILTDKPLIRLKSDASVNSMLADEAAKAKAKSDEGFIFSKGIPLKHYSNTQKLPSASLHSQYHALALQRRSKPCPLSFTSLTTSLRGTLKKQHSREEKWNRTKSISANPLISESPAQEVNFDSEDIMKVLQRRAVSKSMRQKFNLEKLLEEHEVTDESTVSALGKHLGKHFGTPNDTERTASTQGTSSTIHKGA